MTIVIPRYFEKSGQLKSACDNSALGAEFRIDRNMKQYAIITTSHVLVFVLRGRKIIHQKTQDLIIEAGSYVFIPKGSYIFSDIHAKKEEYSERIVLFFEDAFLLDFLSKVNSHESTSPGESLFARGTISPLLQHSLLSLQPYLQKELLFGEELLRSKLNEVLYTLLESDKSGTFLGVLKQLCSLPQPRLRQFMEKSVTHPLTVAEFAKLSCRSSRQFTRDFQALFNETPQNWIRDKRLEHAHQQLHRTDSTISDICYESGFRNYSYFIQIFRKRYGLTPKQIRAQNQHKMSSQ